MLVSGGRLHGSWRRAGDYNGSASVVWGYAKYPEIGDVGSREYYGFTNLLFAMKISP